MAREQIGECLADQTLLELVEGRLDDAARAQVTAHASRCAECRQLLSLLARRSAAPMASTLHAEAGEREREEEDDELRPGDVVGRYVVHSRIGAGGMGVVYAAHDPELGRPVALKVLRTDLERAVVRERMRERLRREAQAMAQLAHPNVVAVHDVGAAGDRVFLTMELVEGTTLAEWTAAQPRGLSELLAQYLAAGRGLAAAHAAGLVHRDFKPDLARPSQPAPLPTDRPHSRELGRSERVYVYQVVPMRSVPVHFLAKVWQLATIPTV